MLLSTSKFFLYVSLFCVAIVATASFFPFIGGKYYFFRAAVDLSLMFFLFWWAFQAAPQEFAAQAKRVVRHPLFIAVTVFTVVYLLACIFAYDPHAAFWSNYERQDGGFTMLHYYIFFFLAAMMLREPKDWRRFFQVSLIPAVLMILYGVAAAAQISGFVGPYVDQSTGLLVSPSFLGRLFSASAQVRFQGSLGNPAYVAPYLMFSIFYALYLWFTSRSKKNKKLEMIVYGGLSVFFFLFFILSETRGAFLGLAAAVVVFFAYLVLTNKRWRKAGLATLAALIVVGGILYNFRNSPFIINNIPGSRLLTISVSDTTAQTRLWTWGSAWKGFKDRPLLGWGPENFTTAFDKYFDPRHFIVGQNAETWFDRAHSIIFDYLTETGILGLLSYLAIFVVAYYCFFKAVKKYGRAAGDKDSGEHPLQRPLVRALVIALPIGYLVQGLVLFDVLPIYINLFEMFAFFLFLFALTDHVATRPQRS